MTMKVYPVTFTIAAGAGWTRLASLPTPTGYSRVLRELRLYFGATSGVKIRLYFETEPIAEISAEVWNKYILPYYFDTSVSAGKSLYFEGANSTASAVTVIAECVVEETTA